MVLPSDDDCDACTPAYMRSKPMLSSTALLSWSPLILTFFIAYAISVTLVVPVLASEASGQDGSAGDFSLLSLATGLRRATESRPAPSRGGRQRLSTITVGITLGLTAVLGELVLAEIVGVLEANARQSALRSTIALLLIVLLIAIPSLEIYSVISSAGWSYTSSTRKPGFRMAWLLHVFAHGIFLVSFWWAGHLMLAQHDLKGSGPKSASTSSLKVYDSFSLLDTTTSHIGVIGISLMALLSGFASVSSSWQNFFSRIPPISETTLSRKQAGLASAREMLATKQSRLRAVKQKLANALSSASQASLLEKAANTFRGNADSAERTNLEMEISGLENMVLGLSSSHAMMANRFAAQERAKTPLGRIIRAAEQLFAVYCMYRIITTVLSFLRRKIIGPAPMSGVAAMSTLHPSDQPTTFDPLMAVLSIAAPSSLDAAALSRQITFLLSGLMLLASFSSVLQTFHLFARFAPWVLRAVNKNLPVIVAQVCGTYVISVAILLRGRLGGRSNSETLTGLGGGELGWVDGWFEGWFLLGACLTAAGIWFGRKVLNADDWDDGGTDLEAGKIS